MRRSLAPIFVLVAGCPAAPDNPAPPPKAKSALATDARPASQPTSQPSSQAASKPSDHPESAEPVPLDALFRMPDTGKVVATVGGQEILRGDLENRLRTLQIQLQAAGIPPDLTRPKVLQTAIDHLVDAQLIIMIGDDLKVEVEEAEIQAWLKNLQTRVESNKAFASFLKMAGDNEAQRRRQAIQSVRLRKIQGALHDALVKDAESEIQDYYERRKDDFRVHAGVETWRIAIRTPGEDYARDREANRKRAEDVYNKAKKDPKSFETLARTYSDGGKRSQGGYLGFVPKGALETGAEKAVYGAKAGTILPPREEGRAFMIYKIGKSRKDSLRPLAEVREEIFARTQKTLAQRKIKERIETLKASKEVVVLVPELTDNTPPKAKASPQ